MPVDRPVTKGLMSCLYYLTVRLLLRFGTTKKLATLSWLLAGENDNFGAAAGSPTVTD